MTGKIGRLERIFLIAACAILAAVRLAAAVAAPKLYEIRDVWEPFSAQIARGASLYDNPFPIYHFFPPWAWMLEGFHAASSALAVPYAAVHRGVLSAVDIGTAFAVASLARRVPGSLPPLRAAALYLASPIAIWVGSVQGQFDGLSLLFLLLAVRASLPPPGDVSVGARAGLLLGASIAAKQVTALHPILWLRGPRPAAAAAVAAACLLPAATLLPYASEGRPMIRALLLYGSVPVSYGFSEWVLFDHRFALPVGLGALAASVTAAIWLRKTGIARASLLLFLVILVFAPGMGAQYLLWPVALASLHGGPRFLLYTGAATLWILGGFLGIVGTGRWLGQLTWLTVVLWAIGAFREEIAARRAEALA